MFLGFRLTVHACLCSQVDVFFDWLVIDLYLEIIRSVDFTALTLLVGQ